MLGPLLVLLVINGFVCKEIQALPLFSSSGLMRYSNVIDQINRPGVELFSEILDIIREPNKGNIIHGVDSLMTFLKTLSSVSSDDYDESNNDESKNIELKQKTQVLDNG